MIALARVTSGLVARIHAWLPWQPCSVHQFETSNVSGIMSALHMAEYADGTWLVSANKQSDVSTFAPDGTRMYWQFGGGKLDAPWGIAVASPETGIHADKVVVAECAQNCVFVFGKVGNPRCLRKFPSEPACGATDGKLHKPQGVAITRGPGLSGAVEVFVTERGNHRVSVFRLSDGTFLRTWGKLGRAPGEFNDPAGVCLTDHGEVVVSDYDNHRIQVFRPDGTFLRQWGTQGELAGQLHHPWGVATWHQEVFVADYHNWRVQVFRVDGTFLRILSHRFAFKPTGLFVSRKGSLLVGQGRSIVMFST